MQTYIEDCANKLEKAEEQLLDVQDDIEDVFDVFDDRIKAINDAVVNKAITSGMAQHHLDQFQEFDIREMYTKKDDTICYQCSRGLTCRKHAFKKQKVLKKKDFDK